MGDTSLLMRISEVTAKALASGALQPFVCKMFSTTQGGIHFPIRLVVAEKKTTVNVQRPPGFNPFLPYEEELFVDHIEPNHVVLLNKFNAVPLASLLVTRDFQPQTDHLNVDDLTALVHCLRRMPGFGFYNRGFQSGSSQPHKHMQLVPLEEGTHMPIHDAVLSVGAPEGQVFRLPQYTFTHAIVRYEPTLLVTGDARQRAETLYGYIDASLAAVRMGDLESYNLLVSRHFLLVVPRTADKDGDIPHNSLAFAGYFLVKSEADLARVQADPVRSLAAVARCDV